MPINFVTGLPRQGKTLFTFIQVQERAKKEGRAVYYCNIPEVTLPGWVEIGHPDEWMDLPDGCIIVVDELQDFWGLAPPGARVPPAILELSKHGKRGMDFYFITQDPTLVHNTPRKLCETHWHVVRAFGSENAVAHKFNRMQTDPERVKNKSEKYPWRYPREAFGKKDKHGNWITKPWYKSADVHNIKRQIPLKVWAIPGGLIAAGLLVWVGIGLFQGAVGGAVDGGAASPFSVPGSGPAGGLPATAPAPSAAPRVLTAYDYVEQRMPRLDGFPHTAPVYDNVTQPVEAPYPAACVSMGERCDCYTQQATLMAVSYDVCAQIVKRGYFVDWRQPEHQARQQIQPSPEARRVQAPPPPAQQQPVIINLPQAREKAPSDSQWSQSLALRNAQVRGSFDR